MAIHDGESGVIFRAVQVLKECVVPGKTRASTAKFRACEKLEKMSELRSIIERLAQTVGGECT